MTPLVVDIEKSIPKASVPKNPNVPSFTPTPPFPQRLKPQENKGKTPEIFEILKQVKINIPLIDIIKVVPGVTQFVKDLCTRKRKLNVRKQAYIVASASSFIQSDIPLKYKDPGCPTISCHIGNFKIEKALLDLGASVNLLPYSVYKQLGLGELKTTRVIL